MDTKKKTRSRDPRRERSGSGAGSAASGRKADAAKHRRQQRNTPTDRGRQQTSRRPEQPVRQPRETENSARRRQPEAMRRPEAAAASDVPEMVFRMDGREERKQRENRDPAAAKRAAMRKRSAQRTEERKKQAQRRSKAPKVIYTQPRPFQAGRLLMQFAIILAVVLAITMGLSVFFKVKQVMVYGSNAYSAQTVKEASGIEVGEKLMSFGRIRASGKIKAALPYVDTVRIGIKLPDTVNIYITEHDVLYAVQSQNGTWWLMTSGGYVVEQTDAGTATSYTKVLGVELDNPVPGEEARAYELTAAQTGATDAAEAPTVPDETVPVTVTANDRLNAALDILVSLELNDLVGAAASVDVTSISNIELWYGNQYQVRLGDRDNIDYKITAMKQSIAQLSDYQTGILDVSFTTWPDQPGYTPFE